MELSKVMGLPPVIISSILDWDFHEINQLLEFTKTNLQ
jgi:hypothetical protein